MNRAIIIMAGGMGSRYGGLKQVDSFGPNNESILDYSIFDAIKAGFNKVVILSSPKLEAVSYTHLTLPTICSV